MAMSRAFLILSTMLLAGVTFALLPGSSKSASTPGGSAPTSDFNPKSVPVYVSAFDINAAPPRKPTSDAPPPATQPVPPKAQSGVQPAKDSPRVLSDADANTKQAARLQSFFGDALLQALRKSGYTAAPQPGTPPEKGVLLKGVFAEVDSQNHNCLAILGGGTSAPQFVLYVGAYNLARPDQSLYRVMTMENCDAHYGPLISLNNYIPMEKYDISKSPSEEEVRKICAQIVANLTALLSVNSAAFSD